MRVFFVAILAFVLSATPGLAITLSSVVGSTGGTYQLNGSTTYTDALNLVSGTTTIEGHGATLNLGGADRYIQVNNATLNINNVTITNGTGMFTQGNGVINATGVTFQNLNYSVLTNSTAVISLTNCTINNLSEYAINGGGGQLFFDGVTVNGKGIALYNGASLTLNDSTMNGGTSSAVNLLSSNPRCSLSVDGSTFTGYDVAIVATNFAQFAVENSTFTNNKRGVFVSDSPGGTATVEGCTITGFGVSQPEEGINFQDIGTVSASNLRIARMRSGIVGLRVGNFTLRDSLIYTCQRNQINNTDVQNSLIERCSLEGKPITGTINVDDFDNFFILRSNVTFRNSFSIDSPDNGILVNAGTLLMEHSFIANSRSGNLTGRGDDALPLNSPGSTLTVLGSTTLNGRTHNMEVGITSKLTQLYSISGMTEDNSAFPSGAVVPTSDPLLGNSFLMQSPDVHLFYNLAYRPTTFGIFMGDFTQSPLNATSEISGCTVYGNGVGTSEGLFYLNPKANNNLFDTMVFNLPPGNRRALLADGSGKILASRNWFEFAGKIGMIHNLTGQSNLANNYWGAASGPSGIFGGSGSQVFGINGSFILTPFLTGPPMASAMGTINVDAGGNGTADVQTDRVRARVIYSGEPATKPSTGATSGYSAVVGLTDYRGSNFFDTLPPIQNDESRAQFNLWLDTRLFLYLSQPGNAMALDLAIKDSANVHAATLTWRNIAGSLVTIQADEITQDGSDRLARFTISNQDGFPTSLMALRTFTTPINTPTPSPTPSDSNVVYTVAFQGSETSGWTEEPFLNPAWTMPVYNRAVPDALRIGANGSNLCAGAWSSSLISVTPGNTLDVRFRVRSSSPADQTPTLRFRVGEELFRKTVEHISTSTLKGEDSPGTTPANFHVFYEVPSFVTKVRANIDLLSFDPTDAANANIDLMEVELRKISPIASGGTSIYSAEFGGTNTKGWSQAPFLNPDWTAPVYSTTSNSLRIGGAGSNVAAGAWTSPLIAVNPGTLVLAEYRIRSSAAADKSPTLRFRIGEESFRKSVEHIAESTATGDNSPGPTTKTFRVLYDVPSFVTNVRLNLDLLSFDPANDANASIDLLGVDLTEFPD